MKHNEGFLKLIALAEKTRLLAYSPYSQFKVGCAIESEEGDFFAGCNIENASFSVTICAERAAISQLISSGFRHIKALAISADSKTPCYPCGVCLQAISEFASPETPILTYHPKTNVSEVRLLKELLPMMFGGEQFGSTHE